MIVCARPGGRAGLLPRGAIPRPGIVAADGGGMLEVAPIVASPWLPTACPPWLRPPGVAVAAQDGPVQMPRRAAESSAASVATARTTETGGETKRRGAPSPMASAAGKKHDVQVLIRASLAEFAARRADRWSYTTLPASGEAAGPRSSLLTSAGPQGSDYGLRSEAAAVEPTEQPPPQQPPPPQMQEQMMQQMQQQMKQMQQIQVEQQQRSRRQIVRALARRRDWARKRVAFADWRWAAQGRRQQRAEAARTAVHAELAAARAEAELLRSTVAAGAEAQAGLAALRKSISDEMEVALQEPAAAPTARERAGAGRSGGGKEARSTTAARLAELSVRTALLCVQLKAEVSEREQREALPSLALPLQLCQRLMPLLCGAAVCARGGGTSCCGVPAGSVRVRCRR